jgi:hypothetical protein
MGWPQGFAYQGLWYWESSIFGSECSISEALNITEHFPDYFAANSQKSII